MGPFSILLRLLLTFTWVSFVPVLMGAAIAGGVGVLAGAALAGLVLAATYFLSEKILLGRLGSPSPMPEGLARSYGLAATGFEFTLPSLIVLPASSVRILALRGGKGDGTLVVTQGLIASFTEQELRAILRLAICRVRERGMPIRCLAATLALRVCSWAPTQWVHLILLGQAPQAGKGAATSSGLNALRAVLFITLLPGIRSLIGITAGPELKITIEKTGLRPDDPFLDTAVKKLTRSHPPGTLLENPCLHFLNVTDSSRSDALIPISDNA